MGKGKGSGTTPQRVQALLAEAVKAESQYAVAKKTGLALSVIQGILKGGREPTTGTLTKLSAFFGVPVHELRGEIAPLGVGLDALPEEYRALVKEVIAKLSDKKSNSNVVIKKDVKDIAIELREYGKLRDEGLITEEDYHKKKEELLKL